MNEEWIKCNSCNSRATRANKCFQCDKIEKEISEILGCNISIIKPVDNKTT